MKSISKIGPFLVMLVGLHLCARAQEQELSLDDLKDQGVFRVKVDGNRFKSLVGRKTSVYQEVTHGTQINGDWATYTSDAVSDSPVTVITPKGKIQLPTVKLRLYLLPSLRRSYTRRTASKAPKFIRDEVAASDEPIVIEEYRLEPGRRYYARVNSIDYYLPTPNGEAAPVRHVTLILQISDRPFNNGEPAQPASPATRRITY